MRLHTCVALLISIQGYAQNGVDQRWRLMPDGHTVVGKRETLEHYAATRLTVNFKLDQAKTRLREKDAENNELRKTIDFLNIQVSENDTANSLCMTNYGMCREDNVKLEDQVDKLKPWAIGAKITAGGLLFTGGIALVTWVKKQLQP